MASLLLCWSFPAVLLVLLIRLSSLTPTCVQHPSLCCLTTCQTLKLEPLAGEVHVAEEQHSARGPGLTLGVKSTGRPGCGNHHQPGTWQQAVGGPV